MLIPIKPFLEQNGIKIRGVIHVGAHEAQEDAHYVECSIKKRLYVEPCKEPFSKLQAMFKDNPDVIMYNVACADYVGIKEMFTSKQAGGQSNSLLAPKIHLQEHKEVVFDGKEMVKVQMLDNIEFDKSAYNMINCDVQGGELLVLKGAAETLKHIDVCYLEVNKAEVYEGCCLIEELDSFLSGYGFERKVTEWAGNFSWGDAIWIKNKPITQVPFPKEATESKPEAELTQEPKSEIPVEPPKPSYDETQPQYHLQQAGVYDALCKANLADSVIRAMAGYQKQVTRDKLNALQREVLGTCRFDMKFYSDKYANS